jgi:hypothetical protein
MKNFFARSGLVAGGLLIGAGVLVMPPYAVSSSQPSTVIATTEQPIPGNAQMDATADFIAGAYVSVKYEDMKASGVYEIVETNDAVTTNQSFDHRTIVTIRGSLTREMGVMTCNVETGALNTRDVQDCNGGKQTISHAFLGATSFDNEVQVSNNDLPTSSNHISIDVSYI